MIEPHQQDVTSHPWIKISNQEWNNLCAVAQKLTKFDSTDPKMSINN